MTRTSFYLSALFVAIGALLLLPPASLAQSSTSTSSQSSQNVGLGIKGLGGTVGFVDPEGASSTVSLGLFVDAGTIAPSLHVKPYMQYWSVGASSGGYDINKSDLAFALDLNYDFPIQGSRVTPYLGTGLGLHFFDTDASVPGGTNTSDTKVGIDLQGGITSPVMPNFNLFAETRYTFISDDGEFNILGGFTYLFVY
jgi:opacity protein-like surface antigen